MTMGFDRFKYDMDAACEAFANVIDLGFYESNDAYN